MKNIFFTFFFALILGSFSAFSQTSQLITHVDTLQSGDVIVTISDSQGNIINKGLAMPGFVLQNDTTDMVFPTGGSDENPNDVFVDNIDLPGDNGGFLPQDVVFNSHNGKYYIYGYRKIMICDENMQVVKTIDISDVDGFSAFYSDYHERRIFVHPTQNKVYGLTINGALFSIDQYYNRQFLTSPIGNFLIERSSLIFRESDNTIWYYFYVKDETMTDKTLLYKYALSNSQLSPTLPIQGIIGYDIEAISYETSYLILVSTNEGIMRYYPDMTSLLRIEPQNSFGHIAVMNNLIFAHLNSNSSILICNADGEEKQTLTLNYPDVRFTLPDPTYNKMYLSGYSESSSGIDIIWYNVTQWEVQNCTYQNIFGLTENSTQVIGCGQDKVVFYDKQTGNQTYLTSTSIGQMYRVSPGSSTNIAIATQPLNGNVLKISSSGTQILETGGNISGICRKGDKLYAAVNKFNNKGYILVLNAASGEVIDRVTPSFDFNPVDVFCLDDESVGNDRIYVHYVIPNGLSVSGKLMAINVNDPSPFEIANEVFGNDGLEYVVSPNGTVMIGERCETCPVSCFVYFYNWNLTEKERPFEAVGGCIKEFDYIQEQELEYLAFTSMCNSTIYFFEDSETEVTLIGNCYVPHPYSFSYNSNEEIGYSFKNDDGGCNFYTIDLESFSSNAFSEYPGLTMVKELFYNPNDGLVYGISEQKVYIIGSGSILGTYDLDANFDIDGCLNRDDDYIFDQIENNLYLPVFLEKEYLHSVNVLAIDLQNGNNTIFSSDLSYQKSVLVLFPFEKYSLFGKTLTNYINKQIIFCAQMYFSNSTLITTHNENKTLTGNWDWISFPCMPRLGNEGFASQAFLQNINPLPEYLRLITKIGGFDKELTYENQIWNTDYIPFLYSTQGYKYDSEPDTIQSLKVTGVVLDPSTPVPLSSQYENWIGYFLEYPLHPEKAFALVWDKLTRITTKNWTMVKVNGQWISATRITPINYGDGLIVTCSEDCELIWGYQYPASEEYEYPLTEYFGYDEKSEYIPFYFEMDSISGIQEIGLTVNDSCVGAAVVEPGDSIVEVNAYLAGFPSGVPIDVETWSGYKSARIGTGKYSVVDPSTRKRVSRKVYTGEQKAFYIISFKAGETEEENPLVILNPASPNPFSSATMLSFVLNQQANVALTVHDLRGNLIKTLMHGVYNEGFYEAGWTGTDNSGKQAGNGIYIIRLTVDAKIIKHEKVVLIK